MEVNALQQMLSRLRQVQEDLQRQVNSVAVEASAGGGMVVVKMNGQKQVLEVRIEPEVFAGKDQEMLQDLVRAAVNEAGRRVDEELANQMKSLAGNVPGMSGLKIPGLFSFLSSPSKEIYSSESSSGSVEGVVVPAESAESSAPSTGSGVMDIVFRIFSSLWRTASLLDFFSPSCALATAVTIP